MLDEIVWAKIAAVLIAAIYEKQSIDEAKSTIKRISGFDVSIIIFEFDGYMAVLQKGVILISQQFKKTFKVEKGILFEIKNR